MKEVKKMKKVLSILTVLCVLLTAMSAAVPAVNAAATINIGDYITSNSYQNDTIFEVINRKKDILYLKGVEFRLYADANVSDCVLLNKEEILKKIKEVKPDKIMDRSEYFYLPAKILHLDGDNDYLDKCMK